MTSITFTATALHRTTPAQVETLNRLATDQVESIEVAVGGFSLPTGYLGVCVKYVSGHSIVGGLSSEGDFST